MKLPDYLPYDRLAAPINYEWSRLIANRFQGNPAEDNPKLFKALHEISVRAAFSLGVACSEWAAARLQPHTDVSDLLLRIEAAWAATIDWRYASLPEPKSPKAPSPDPVAEAVWLTALFLSYDHGFLVETYKGLKNRGVRGSALRLALLVRHIAPKSAGFDKWLTASLMKAKEHYPAAEVPIQQEAVVPPDFYDPKFKWSEQAVRESVTRFLSSLNPGRNKYLRKAAQMQADGFKGEPYTKPSSPS